MNNTEHELKMGQRILVRGGYTGTKLHSGMVGGSSLGCGHWTKASITNFMVADNIDTETLEAAKSNLCEKCFPQYADENKPKAEYSGPKVHMKRLRTKRNAEGKLVFSAWQGSACGRRSLYGYGFSDFKNAVAETPEKICSKCLSEHERLIAEVKRIRENENG